MNPIVVLGGSGHAHARQVQKADVLAGGQRQLAQFPHFEGRRIVVQADTVSVVAEIRAAVEAGQRVVVLASGDPLLYGIGATLVRELGADRVRIEPGISSVQLAFARISEPWHDAAILSAHGRPLAEIVPQALASVKMAILTDATATPATIAGALLEAGMEDCRAVVGESLGHAEERIVETRLRQLPGQEFAPLNVLLLFRSAESVRLDFGRSEQDFESVRGQITKAEVRAVALSKLRLSTAGVLWDIGAGSGALAIEAARLMPRGRVYAIERDAGQLACLRRNAARLGAGNLQVIEGEAPEALAGLPAPQSVFIGGTGGRLADVLAAVPTPFTINLAVLEHVGTVLNRFPNAEVVQLAISRSTAVPGGHRLAALNPVYILTVPA